MSDTPVLSIVIPVYNEEESVLPLYQSNQAACDPLGKAYEIIFVDDGSEDGTYGILAQIHRRDARVKVIRYEGICLSLHRPGRVHDDHVRGSPPPRRRL